MSRSLPGATSRTLAAPAIASTSVVSSIPRPSGARTIRPPPSPPVKATPTPWIDQSIAFQSLSTPLVDPGWKQPPWRLPVSAPTAHPWLPCAERTSRPRPSPISATPPIASSPQTIPALQGLRRARRWKAPRRLTSGRGCGRGADAGAGAGGGGASGAVPA
ncbi:MAG: hypothetical protein E6J03_04380 [Chloroflexi bacterium]|nr:MAG: hypothetical protein E6J03_04380 [Chloroflexota bacterium]